MNKTSNRKWNLKSSEYTFFLRYMIKYTPMFVVYICMLGVISALATFTETVYSLKFITDCIQYDKPFRNIIIYIICILIFIFLRVTLEDLYGQYFFLNQSEKLKLHIRMDLYKKVIDLNLGCFDEVDFYNDYRWVISDSNYRIERTINQIRNAFTCFTGLIITSYFILTMDKVGFLFILFVFISTFIINTRISKINYNMASSFNEPKRRKSYINRVFYMPQYAKELRISNTINDLLQKRFEEANNDCIETVKEHSKKLLGLSFLSDFVFNRFIFDGLYLLNLVYKALVLQVISYGGVVGLFNASKSIINNMSSLVRLFSDIQEDRAYIKRINTFFERESLIKPNKDAECIDKNNFNLQLKNVSFSYPKSDKKILNDISLSVAKNEKIAIVGYNGAGKSTLVKLLLRFYDVTDGELLLNGRNIAELNLEDYQSSFGTVFQDFNIYATTIGNNVVTDNMKREEEKKVEMALSKACFDNKLHKLSNGIDTNISKEFYNDGIDLSGGEKQKIAIARAFIKDYNCIILDEPNSALDTMSESKINESILELAENRSLIIISHRLTITKKVDRIYVMDKGKVVEVGCHNELMNHNGLYAKMFRVQAEKYKVS